MSKPFTLNTATALDQLAQLDTTAYANTRNHLHGAVSRLSPFLTHGVLTMRQAAAPLIDQISFNPQHKWLYELGWRAYFQHVWQHLGYGIFESIHEGVLPDAAYSPTIPPDVLCANTGVPAIDQAVSELYATGYLHNHARMWLASYVVHWRKVHWLAGARWMYGHLLDGDLASNALSWQWVAGTGSSKPYVFNADNIAQFAPVHWHSPNSAVDVSYDTANQIAVQRNDAVSPVDINRAKQKEPFAQPACFGQPPESCLKLGRFIDANTLRDWVTGKSVQIVHAWSLADIQTAKSEKLVILGVLDEHFHTAHPWSELRWTAVCQQMAHQCDAWIFAPSQSIVQALGAAQSVTLSFDQHVMQGQWLKRLQDQACVELSHTIHLKHEPALFSDVPRHCTSFSAWWKRTQLLRAP